MKLLVVIFVGLFAATEAVLFMRASLHKRFHGYLERHFLLKLIWRTAKSIVFLVVIFTALAWVPDQPAEQAWLFIYLLPVILGAIIWLMVRLCRRHGFSAIVSVAAAVLILSGIQYAFMRREAEIAIRMVPDNAGTLDSDITAVDLSDLLRSCDNQLCLEVLAETNYDVLVRDGIHSIIRGATCDAAAYDSSHFLFLKAGYAATCHGIVGKRKPGRLLVIEQHYCHEQDREDSACDQLPASFSGHVVTVRIESSEDARIVRQWLEGGIKPVNGWFALVGLESLPVGDWNDLGDLLTRALNVQIKGFGVRDGGDLDRVLTELESFLDRPAYADKAVLAFWDASYERGRDNQDVLKAHIERLIDQDDRSHILAGLNLITPRSEVDVSALRPRLVQLSQRGDGRVKDYADRALRHIARLSPAN